MKVRIIAALCCAFSMQAFAETPQCEVNFTKEGSFFKGTTFKTWAVVDNTDYAGTFKKVYRHIVVDGWKVSDSNAEVGIISAAQTVSYGKGKTAPLNVVIEEVTDTSNKISITYSLSGGVRSPKKAVMESFCKTIASAKS